jgi:tRNA threonylcarbamoyladenosine biosynthesis protein TsaB
MDARRDQVYHGLFACEDGKLTRLVEDCAISLQELGEELGGYSQPILLVGDGAKLCHKTLGYPCAPEHLCMQRASGVALAAEAALLRGEAGDGGALVPNYLRLSQAERERNERLKAES